MKHKFKSSHKARYHIKKFQIKYHKSKIQNKKSGITTSHYSMDGVKAWSKLAIRSKHQGVKWLFLKDWGKTIKMTKPQGAKQKFAPLKSSK
ncbi:hypothetical protein HanIR_Chr09g0446801 [Helianthus annuus]|nr:hypothetical protein HanIR_Chr09g0446801 [Helianthus annuus]